jgi:SWI/SNF-related matrix-associated actin-dependent regulator of chromatin subfamily D
MSSRVLTLSSKMRLTKSASSACSWIMSSTLQNNTRRSCEMSKTVGRRSASCLRPPDTILTDPLCRQQIAKLMEPRRPIGPMHDFSRERAESPRPVIRSRANSSARTRSPSPSPDSADSEMDDEPPQTRSRKGSVRSRTGSVGSRKRSDSQTTTGSAVEGSRERKEKEKKKGSWSVWSRNGSKKDRDQFASLRGDPDDESDSSDSERVPGSPTQTSKNSSLLSLGKWTKSQQNNSTTRIPALGTRSDRQLVVRAVSDYLGSSDELSFRIGDEIVVLGEVIDGWMMGQLDGKKGLFPTVYTESITAASNRTVSKPPAAPTPPLHRRKSSSKAGSIMDSPSGSRQSLVEIVAPIPPRPYSRAAQAQAADTSGDDNDASHPFGDHNATTQDTDQEHGAPVSAALGGGYGFSYDSESLAESAADESEHEKSSLVRRRASDDDGFVNHRTNNNNDNSGSVPPKKVPPPLPRRQPEVRKAPPPPPPPPPRRPDVRASPQPPVYGLQDSQTGDCVDFVQAVGRATGMCTNCQRMHIY